jgi:spore photoproduct lyase
LDVIDRVFAIFDSPADYAKILWFSMGSLRFEPKLKEMMRTRFPQSQLPLGEFVLSNDNKYRYFKPLRARVYKTIGQALFKKFPALPLYLCMEGKDVWKDVFPRLPIREDHYRPLYA